MGLYEQKYFINENFFKEISYEQAYFIGLMAADGCIQSDKRIDLSQSNQCGLELITQVKEMIGHTGNVYHSRNAHSIYFLSKTAVDFLAKYKVIKRKTYVFEYPKELPEHLLPYFLRGYFDGDGSLGYYDNGKGKYTFIMSFVGTIEFINHINKLLPVQGRLAIIKRCKNLAEIRFYQKDAKFLYNYLYSQTPSVNIRSAKQEKYEKIIFIKPDRDKYKPNIKNFIKYYKAGKTILEISRIINVRFQTLYGWKKKYIINGKKV